MSTQEGSYVGGWQAGGWQRVPAGPEEWPSSVFPLAADLLTIPTPLRADLGHQPV